MAWKEKKSFHSTVQRKKKWNLCLASTLSNVKPAYVLLTFQQKKNEQCTSERNISGQRSRVDRSNQAPQGTINRVSEREVARDYNKSNKKLTIKR
jgi:hypothetical protein